MERSKAAPTLPASRGRETGSILAMLELPRPPPATNDVGSKLRGIGFRIPRVDGAGASDRNSGRGPGAL